MYYDVGFEVCAAVMLIVFTIFVRFSNPLKKPQNTAYINMSVCIILTCISDVVSSLLINAVSDGMHIPLFISHIANNLFFIMTAFCGYYYCLYLYTIIGKENFRKSLSFRLIKIPIIIYIFFTVINPWTGLLFYFNENGIYTFGSMHFVITITMLIYIIIGLLFLIINRKKMTTIQFVSALIFNSATGFGLIIQRTFLPNVCIGAAVAAMSIIMIYFSIQTPDSYTLVQTLDELERAKNKAVEASRAKEDFLKRMSHEIRTPINSLLGMNEMIIHTSKEDNIVNYAMTAQKSGKALISLVNNVLDYTKLNNGEFAVIEKAYISENVFTDVICDVKEQLAEKNIEFDIEIDDRIPKILVGDEIRIRQILGNLLSNAVKYTDEGRITFSAEYEPMDEAHAKINYSISDTGCGIREDDLNRIFGSFVRIDKDKNIGIDGAGLGLSVAAMLLKTMDSKIQVSSEYGKGSTFSFGIIQAIADNTPIGKISVIPDKIKSENVNGEFSTDAEVLIVDDSEVNLFVMQEILKQFKIRADVANGGEKCFEMASERAYDLIFLDHMMPEPDGLKTMRMIKETAGCASRNSVIIVLTANAVVGAKEQYLEVGFDDYISKPVDFKAVNEMLVKYLPEKHFEAEQFADNDRCCAELFSGLKLSYIDIALGIKNCRGNSAAYFECVDTYARLAADYAVRFEEDMADGNMEDYAIAAHAVKSASMDIGAVDLADMAKLQEMFALINKSEEVISLHHDFIQALTEVTAEAQKICINNAKKNDAFNKPNVLREITSNELLSILKKTVETLYNYNEAAAVEAISALDDTMLNGEPCFNKAEAIRSRIRDFDMDGAAQLVNKYISEIN